MTGFYGDVYGDIYGASPGPAAPAPVTTRPRVSVQMAFGSATTVDETGAGWFKLNSSLLDGIDVLGSVAWVEIADDVTSVEIRPGQTSNLEAAAPSTCTIVVDNFSGAYDPLNTASPYAGTIDVGQHVWIKAINDDGAVDNLWRGYIDDVIPDYGFEPSVTFTCSDGLAVLGRAGVGEIPAQFDGDRTGTRIGRILDAALWPASLRSLATGLMTVQADTYGDYALPLIQRIVDSEAGALYVDGAGVLVFSDRLTPYVNPRSTTVQATFSDTGTGIEMEQLPASLERGKTFNEARLTRVGGVEQVAVSAASRDLYGLQTFPGQVGTMLRTDADVLAMAYWVVSQYNTPTVRFPEIVVDATTQDAWTQLLGLRKLDRVHVDRSYGPVSIGRDLLVESVGHTITQERWVMTVATRDAESLAPFILGTSKLNGPNRLI